MKTEITPEQFEQLRQAAANDDRPQFERLLQAIIRQAVRDTLARRESSKPIRAWIPQAY